MYFISTNIATVNYERFNSSRIIRHILRMSKRLKGFSVAEIQPGIKFLNVRVDINWNGIIKRT